MTKKSSTPFDPRKVTKIAQKVSKAISGETVEDGISGALIAAWLSCEGKGERLSVFADVIAFIIIQRPELLKEIIEKASGGTHSLRKE